MITGYVARSLTMSGRCRIVGSGRAWRWRGVGEAMSSCGGFTTCSVILVFIATPAAAQARQNASAHRREMLAGYMNGSRRPLPVGAQSNRPRLGCSNSVGKNSPAPCPAPSVARYSHADSRTDLAVGRVPKSGCYQGRDDPTDIAANEGTTTQHPSVTVPTTGTGSETN